ncbi:MAG: FAD-dependent oxidoreductase [Armatimonadota bacterium]
MNGTCGSQESVPGFQKSWLIDTAPLLGVRDSRRIQGEYVLTGWDVARRAKFDDVIAISWRGFDVHNPTGPGNQKWFETTVDGETRYITAGLDGYASSSLLTPNTSWQRGGELARGVPVV